MRNKTRTSGTSGQEKKKKEKKTEAFLFKIVPEVLFREIRFQKWK